MVVVSINIPDNKIDEFKTGFLKAYPNISGQTDLKHIKQFIREQLLNYYKTGKILIAQENINPNIDNDVVAE